MNKGKIIAISIIGFIVVLNTILFGFVFRLRNIDVVIAEGAVLTENVKKSSNLEMGKSIFLINKDKAISNIEKENPYIKVIQIKTTSVTKVEIVVRARYELFYSNQNNVYYILDEDLKILDIREEEPITLIKLTDKIKIDKNAKISAFVGQDNEKQVVYNLFTSMYGVIDESSTGGQARVDICSKIKSVDFADYNRLIILTTDGVTLDIEKPNTDLSYKINLCFSTIQQLITDNREAELNSSTIKVYYDLDTKLCCVFQKAE